MIRRYIAAIILLMSIISFFCGCSALYEDANLADIPDVDTVYLQSGDIPRTFSEVIYFYNNETVRLEGESRDIIIYPGQNKETVIMNEIMNGPETEELSLALTANLEDIEILDNIANVYLTNAEDNDKKRYLLAAQITDTLIDAANIDIEFVNVFYDGKVMDIDGYAIGAMEKSDGAPLDRYNELCNIYEKMLISKQEISLNIPLYFLNNTYEYFIPDVRKVIVKGQFCSPQDFNESVLKEAAAALADGPETKYYLNKYIDLDYLEADNYSIRFEDGNIEVMPNRGIFITKYDAEVAAFYYTVSGVIPLDGDFRILKEKREVILSRENTSAFAGVQLVVYIPNAQADGLERVTRTVSEERSREPITYVQEIFIAMEESGYFRDEARFSSAFAGSIRYCEDVAMVDLTDKFFSLTSQLDENVQELIVFAIVNTLDATGEVKLTAIRKNGEIPRNFAKRIDLEFPLMPNYGIVK